MRFPGHNQASWLSEMTRKILIVLGFVAALTAASGTAAADEAPQCEVGDEIDAALSPLSPAALAALIAQARPSSPPTCVANGTSDPRCRAERPGDSPTRTSFDPFETQNRLMPDVVSLAQPGCTNVSFGHATARPPCAGYPRDLDRPPQA